MNQNITEESLKRFFKEIYSDADKHQLECLIYPVLQVLYSKPDSKEWVKRDEIIKNIQENYPEIKWGRTGLALDQPFSMKFKGASEEAKFLNQLFEFQADDRPGAIKTAYKLRSENIIAIKAFLENNPIQSEQVINLLKARVTFLNSEKNSDVSGKNAPVIWKISHGTSNDMSNEDHQLLIENDLISVGFANQEDDSKKQRKKFVKDIKKGDYFYLVRNSHIVLFGKFIEMDCATPPDNFSNKNWVARKIEKLYSNSYPSRDLKEDFRSKKGWQPSFRSTVFKVGTNDIKDFEQGILLPVFNIQLDNLCDSDKRVNDRNQNMPNLNQILYGPPGTGKTYNTVTETLKILEKTDTPEGEYLVQKVRFDKFKQDGYIEFVTFHQSFSYEDFVEGIRANANGDKISYAVQDGVFKMLAVNAMFSKLSESPELIKATVEFQKEKTDITQLKYESKKKILSECDYSKFKQNTGAPFVLIIDEINRGNTSKIFGELITLIEDTKRFGNDEAIEVTLPYSGEKFSVPNNLYIIGTMNTADRSLALIDTALRRRFDFIEMMPDASKIKVDTIKGVDVKEMLKAINMRIEALYDREHTIGHAFFMKLNENPNIEDLGKIFKNKILPLLEEYFFEDWEKICLVLGGAEIYKPKDFKNIGFESISKCYERVEEVLNNPATYQAIYKDSAVSTNAETNDQ